MRSACVLLGTAAFATLLHSNHKFRYSSMAYHAFMSYCHSDDARLAPALQSALQRVAKPLYRLRALNIFRDKTGLAATPSLWGAIETAIVQSQYFILLASPQAAASAWVEKEITWWLTNRSVKTLLIVVTRGDLSWDDTRGDFDLTRSSAMPDVLRGQWQAEPLFVDLRWARAPADLGLHNPRFLDAVLDLAAPLHGKAKNDLAGEEVRQSRVVRRLSIAAVLLLTLLTALAWQQRGVARHNAALALDRQQLAERRLRELCESWNVTTAFMEDNFPAAIYDIKGRLHEAFKFEENCRP